MEKGETDESTTAFEKKMREHLPQLKDADNFRKMGDIHKIGSFIVNPIILKPQSDYVKLVLYAQFPNSVMYPTNYSWHLEPVQELLTQINGKIFFHGGYFCIYHQMALSFET